MGAACSEGEDREDQRRASGIQPAAAGQVEGETQQIQHQADALPKLQPKGAHRSGNVNQVHPRLGPEHADRFDAAVHEVDSPSWTDPIHSLDCEGLTVQLQASHSGCVQPIACEYSC